MRATWTGCHVEQPAGIFTPTAFEYPAMQTSVTTLDRRISSITVRVVLFRWRRWADQAARAVDAVSAALGLPSLPPLAFAAYKAAFVRSEIRLASSSATAARMWSVSLDANG
jgi:hypothetical protein